MAAVHGTGYCASAVLAVKTLATNFVRAAAVAYVGWALVRYAFQSVSATKAFSGPLHNWGAPSWPRRCSWASCLSWQPRA